MPAIDPGRLEREVERLQGLFGSPAELSRAVTDVLDFYTDRARRPSTPLAGEERDRSLQVPAPVVRAIGLGLQQQGSADPDAAWAAAEALWQTNLREPRVVACWVLSGCADARVADWVEARAADLGGTALLTSVVDRAFHFWRTRSGRSYVDRIERWLASPRGEIQSLGLRALEAGLEMPEAEDMHRAFLALGRMRRLVRRETRDALEDLLEELARRSPAETTHFLLEALARREPGIDRLARSLLPALPSAHKERLKAALSLRFRRGSPD